MLWVNNELEDFRDSEEQLNGCPDDLVFVDWLLALPVHSASFARGSDLRGMKPVNPA